MGDVVKLTAPNGVPVSVAAEKEAAFVGAGYRLVSEEPASEESPKKSAPKRKQK